MMGAIIGDIIGSIYEFENIKTKDFPLFSDRCTFTDDTVMTVAVAAALMAGGTESDYVGCMRTLGRAFPDRGYGGRFYKWLYTAWPKPYNSFGNGSAMRVSPVAWYFDSPEAVVRAAEASAGVTHNHPEGVKGARAAAEAVYMARTGESKAAIRRAIAEKYGYNLNRTIDAIRPDYTYDVTCQGSVPEAIIAFLDADDFEDAVRNAISIGGDSDTIAAVTGAIAEAYYGIPAHIRDWAWQRLHPTLQGIISRFEDEKGAGRVIPE